LPQIPVGSTTEDGVVMKRCPYCAEQIQDEAIKCKHCGSSLSERDTGSLDASLRAGAAGPAGRYDTLDMAVTQSGHANILAGQYRIVKKLGEGGMGIVYLAEDMELADRSVAIKVLPPVLSKNTRAVENLRREALTAINLNHPNIIRLYGFHSDEEIKFLVMEYIEGRTLEEMLTERPNHRLGFDECVRIVEQVAAALDYAHNQNPPVVHRDLKPSNIMIDARGGVKVLDFGIAREMKDSYTRVTGQQTSGTLPYMSPEQLRGKGADPAMDIYALGAVCYECLSGRTPFHTGDLGYQIIHEPPPALGDVPSHVNEALQAALAKEPQDRPTSAGRLVAAMKGGLGGKAPSPPRRESARIPDAAKPPQKIVASPPVVKRAGKRSKRKVLLLLLLLAGLVAVGVVFRYEVICAVEGTYPVPRHAWLASDAQLDYAQLMGLPITRTVDLGQSVSMEFVLIPPGDFQMGSAGSDEQANADERPQRSIMMSGPLYLGVYEVTQAQWQRVMGTTLREQQAHASFGAGARGRGPHYPMYFVDWRGAMEFCRMLGERLGKQVRLPTETEWEYACRAGSSTDYFFEVGESAWDELGRYAWYAGNSGYRAHPVGQKKPNPWGLYDIYGNVAEWCDTWYGPYYVGLLDYPSDKGGTGLFTGNPFAEQAGQYRVARGGYHHTYPEDCRSARRGHAEPAQNGPGIGFRVVLDDPFFNAGEKGWSLSNSPSERSDL
jgi:formylglycine-generating enzyme required for sulfatase activity/serine/threonine protein kinase